MLDEAGFQGAPSTHNAGRQENWQEVRATILTSTNYHQAKEPTEEPQAMPAPERELIRIRHLKVTTSYEAKNSGELTLEKGAIIQLIRMMQDDWAEGVCDGYFGLFRTSCCEEIGDDHSHDSGFGSKHVDENRKAREPRGNEEQQRARTRKECVKREINFSDLMKGDLLGKGGFGTVYIWKSRSTGEAIAGKEIKLKDVEKSGMRLQEVMKANTLDHPNIVRWFNIHIDAKKLYLFMELMKTSIKNLVDRRPLTENQARAYTSDVLDGLIYLHNQGLTHKDIKGDNILLDSNSIAKLADFGISQWFTNSMALSDTGIKGTPGYISPEVLQGITHGKRSDVWAFGCTVCEMMTGKPPLPDGCRSLPEIFGKTLQFEQARYVLEMSVESEMKDFLRSIFVSVDERPYAEALREDKWLSGPLERVCSP